MATNSQPEEIQKRVKELEKEITCPVCHEHFQEPKILPCCHYYCKGCVQALAWKAGANQPFACPECRRDTFLPSNDPDQLPTAFFVNRMKELHTNIEKAQGKVDALCELCTESKAIAFCRQCAEFICDECTKAHHRMKTFAGHKVATLEELKEGGSDVTVSIKQPPPPTCKVHDEQMKIYCYDCKHIICRDCVVDEHAGHKYEFFKKAAPAIQQKLAESLLHLKEVQVTLDDASKVLKSAKSDVESQGASAAAKIECSFQELHNILEQCKQELLEKTSSLVKGKLDGLSAQKKGVDMAAGTIQSLVGFVERNIENATEEELVSIHAQLLDRINEETKKHERSSVDLEPVEEADIVVDVRCAVELRKLCHDKAIVVSSPADSARSTVEGDGIKNAEVNKPSKVTLRVAPMYEKRLEKPVSVKANLKSTMNGETFLAKVNEKEIDTYEIKYTPRVRGPHLLEITVNGLSVAGSPFPVFVKISPTQLGKPLRVYPGLKGVGIAINSKNEMVFAEQDSDILFLDRAGNQLHVIKKSEHGFQKLVALALDDNDDIYVTDSGSSCVHKFDSCGANIKTIKFTEPKFSPTGIAVSGNQVIVADMGNNQLLFFTQDLRFYRNRLKFRYIKPAGIACDQEGNIYISDLIGKCIQVLNAKHRFLYRFTNANSFPGFYPQSICINNDFIYVSEWANEHCVSIFSKEGKILTSIHSEFNKPRGLAIDNDGFLYVCDFGNSRIQMF